MEAVSGVCCRALKGKPHLEFLVSAMMEDEAVAWVVGQTDTPAFRALTEEFYLDTEAEEESLMSQLGSTAPDSGEEDPFEPLPGDVFKTPEGGGEAEEDGFSLLKDLFAPCGAKEDAT